MAVRVAHPGAGCRLRGLPGGATRGAFVYNVAHTYASPLLLGGYGVFGPPGSVAATALGVALIWLAHIAIDRVLGYGLKYDTAFKDTHLGRI